jgi:hypothetical protein
MHGERAGPSRWTQLAILPSREMVDDVRGQKPRRLALPESSDRHQARIAAGRGCVRSGRAFLDEVGEVVILAGGKTGAG